MCDKRCVSCVGMMCGSEVRSCSNHFICSLGPGMTSSSLRIVPSSASSPSTLLIHCREPLIEKHWRGITSRDICDFFWNEVTKYDSKEVIPSSLQSAYSSTHTGSSSDYLDLKILSNQCLSVRDLSTCDHNW